MATIKGIWVFNENPDIPFNYWEEQVSFRSGGNQYTSMASIYAGDDFSDQYYLTYGTTRVYGTGQKTSPDGWLSTIYQSVEFDEGQTVSESFLSWLKANATQQQEEDSEQSATATIKFVITSDDGVTLSDIQSYFEAAEGQSIQWNGTKITSDTIEVSESGTLYLVEGHANGYHINNDLIGTTVILQAGETLIINYTTVKESSPDVLNYYNVTVTLEEENPAICTITYNGKVIASLNGGESATLTCGGKKALTNIEIVSENGATATYDGKEISAGNAFTLACAGKKMLTDVVVAALTDNADSIVGTWRFNDDIVTTATDNAWYSHSVDFICQGATYTSIAYTGDGLSLSYRDLTQSPQLVTTAKDRSWKSEAYKFIEIINEPTDESFVAFLKANATQSHSGGSS